MAVAHMIPEPEDCESTLINEADVDPATGSAPRTRGRRGVLKLTLALAVVAIGAMAFRSYATRGSPSADAIHDLALYGQHMCRACQGQQCGCDWANENSCSAQAYSSDCCWSCCCAQNGFHQFQRPAAVVASAAVAPPASVSGVGACSLAHGQGVRVTGNSGTTYHATIIGPSGSDRYQVGISGQSYSVGTDRISECQPWSPLLTFWLPLLFGLVLLGVLAFIIYKKVKGKEEEEAKAPAPAPSRTCCGK